MASSNLIESIPNTTNSYKSIKTIVSLKRIEENYSENNDSSRTSFDHLLEISSERSQSEKNDLIEESSINFMNFINLLGQININRQRLLEHVKEAKIEAENIPDLRELEKEYTDFFIKNYRKKKKRTKNWSTASLTMFAWIVGYYCELRKIHPQSLIENDWRFLASFFPFSTVENLKFKWFSLKKSQGLIQPWNEEEDLLLKEIAQKFDKPKWTKIALEFNSQIKLRNMNMSTVTLRMPKHCRERWNNYLNPTINKGVWTPEEDLMILQKVAEIGKKWSTIARLLQGRNEHSVKNHFYSLLHISKKKKGIDHKMSEAELQHKIAEKIEYYKNMEKSQKNLLKHEKTSLSNISSIRSICKLKKKVIFNEDDPNPNHHSNSFLPKHTPLKNSMMISSIDENWSKKVFFILDNATSNPICESKIFKLENNDFTEEFSKSFSQMDIQDKEFSIPKIKNNLNMNWSSNSNQIQMESLLRNNNLLSSFKTNENCEMEKSQKLKDFSVECEGSFKMLNF